MIWLAWRQLRMSALAVGAAMVALGVALAITGPHLVHLYDTTVKTCESHGDCPEAIGHLRAQDHLLQLLGPVVLVAPLLAGVFWGAPLVAREIENRTLHLVWAQSVSRTRWLATKLALMGLASMVATGLFTLMVTWWSSPIDRTTNTPFSPSFFDRRDIVPIGYAAFAFMVGVVAGMLIRRTVPAMAATIVAYVAARLAFVSWVRPHLASPLHFTTALSGAVVNGPSVAPGTLNPGDWILSDTTLNAAGRVIGQNGGIGPNGDISFGTTGSGPGSHLVFQGVGTCPNAFHVALPLTHGGPPSPAFQSAASACVNSFHLRQVLTYQPANRFWEFQWMEMGIFVAIALALAAGSLWWIRHRLS